MEENIKADISAEELSQIAGFSLFHYCRLFQQIVGMPVMQYAVSRRLMHAIYEIACGEKMVEAALVYGFDTYAGFFKAFRREYDCSPSEYLKTHRVQKPCPFNLEQEGHRMITHKKASDILRYWGLEEERISSIYYEDTGNKNENAFYVGERYVLKTSAGLAGLKNHIEIARALEKEGMLAATPVLTRDGHEYINDSGLYFILTNRIRGKQLMCEELYPADHEMTQKLGQMLGQMLGRLHKTLKNNGTAICNEINLLENVTEWALPKTREVMELPDGFADSYLTVFSELYPQLPRQIIHRDPNPGNIILSENGVGFIDFDLSEINVRIFDPCYASTAVLCDIFANNTARPEEWLAVYQTIIAGYDRVARLSKFEKQVVPYVVFSIQMICVAYFSGLDKF